MSFRHAGPSNSALVLNYTKELAYGLKKIWTEIALRGSSNRVGARDDLFFNPLKSTTSYPSSKQQRIR